MECSVLTTERVEEETPSLPAIKSGSFKPIKDKPIDRFGKEVPDVTFDPIVSDHQITETDSGRFMKPVMPLPTGPPGGPPG